MLWRSLTRADDGRWLVRIGRESGYVTVAETPWIVRAVRDAGEGRLPILVLSDGSEEPLDAATLCVGSDGVLRCAASRGRPARFGRAAQVALGSALEEAPTGSGRFVLEVCGERWPVVRVK